jgi:hypothetical protein
MALWPPTVSELLGIQISGERHGMANVWEGHYVGKIRTAKDSAGRSTLFCLFIS